MWAENTSIVKVGKSNRPAHRCSGIQVSNPFKMCVAGCHVMPAEVAVAVEQSFHRRHCAQPYHIRGEWYRLTPKEANRLVSAEAALFGVDTASDLQTGSSDVASAMVSMWKYNVA
jgi:hypothetical protein